MMRRTILVVAAVLVTLAMTMTAPAGATPPDSLRYLGSFDTYTDLGFSPDDVAYSPIGQRLFITGGVWPGTVYETTLAGELVAEMDLEFGLRLGYSIARVTTGPSVGHFFLATQEFDGDITVLEFDKDWNLISFFDFTGSADSCPGDAIAYNPMSMTLLITDNCNSEVFEVTMQGDVLGSFAAGSCGVAGFVFNPPTRTYLAACPGINTLNEFSLTGEPLRSWDLEEFGVGQPVGVAAGQGKVFIADEIDFANSGGLIHIFQSP